MHFRIDSTVKHLYKQKLFAQIAQLVEQWTENPRVAGSTPALGTILILTRHLSGGQVPFASTKETL